jgi:hypothetical protein
VALYSFPAHKFVSFNVGLAARLLQLRGLLSSDGPINARFESAPHRIQHL